MEEIHSSVHSVDFYSAVLRAEFKVEPCTESLAFVFLYLQPVIRPTAQTQHKLGVSRVMLMASSASGSSELWRHQAVLRFQPNPRVLKLYPQLDSENVQVTWDGEV